MTGGKPPQTLDPQRTLPPGHRGLRLANGPSISIVLASTAERARLEACLDVLVPACVAHGVEVVVARSCPVTEYHELAGRYPGALFMPAPDNASPAVLRAAGLSAADGDIVGFADDGRVVDAEWVKTLATRGAVAGS